MRKCSVVSMEGWRNPAQPCADAGKGKHTQHSWVCREKDRVPKARQALGAYSQPAEPRKQRTNRTYRIAC